MATRNRTSRCGVSRSSSDVAEPPARRTTTPAAGTEREVKLAPPAGFDLESLGDVLPALELRATYFDTGSLTLARAGITIRHRTGEGPPTWTVKLPAGDGHGVMVRRELNLVGDRDHRPREVSGTVAAHLRGRRLVPVATLVTLRSRVLVSGTDTDTDTDSASLLEVSLDRVTATRGVHPLGSWEEIEVEVVRGDGAGDAQRRVVRALRTAGCTKVAPVAKLVRALGDVALAPPEVAVVDLSSSPTVAEVLQHAIRRSVAQLLAHDPAVRLGGDPEDLHQFRVAVRRLRSDLRTFRKVLGADPDVTDRIRRELRWVADATNAPRDLDVLRDWLHERSSRLPPADRPGVDDLVRRGDEQASLHRVALLEVLGAARYDALLHDLVGLLATSPDVSKRQDHRDRRSLARQVRRRWKGLEAQMAALGDHPADRDLHQARIAAKRCRAAVEATAPLVGRRARRLAKSLGHLQDVLGAVHDRAVIERWLRDASSETAPFVAGQLAEVARAEGRDEAAHWPEAWAKVQRRHDAVVVRRQARS